VLIADCDCTGKGSYEAVEAGPSSLLTSSYHSWISSPWIDFLAGPIGRWPTSFPRTYIRPLVYTFFSSTNSLRLYDINMFKRNSLCSMRSLTPLLQILFAAIVLLSFAQIAAAYQTNRYFERNPNPLPRPARWGPPTKRDSVPLVISNNCAETIWPGIGTQAGTGAGTGGFELASGDSRSLTVSADWQGRVWGRTNCSFNVAGTGASNLNGNDGSGAACDTGDCGGVLSCVLTVSNFPDSVNPLLIFSREQHP
jgi:hypothetical protein